MPRALALWSLALVALSADACADAWQALREGQALLLIRHATAPGVGDPPGFALDDCSTQRNLNERGRSEARAWGELLRGHGIAQARLYSSRWCRAMETAESMALGPVLPLPALDSFFRDPRQEAEQTASLRRLLDALRAGDPVVLITHQVNVTALTGVFPRSGEGLIIASPLADPPQVLERVPAP